MARVTIAEVEEILEVDPSITTAMKNAFINVANLMVTKVVTASDMTADHKKEIERWLAAHFIAIRDVKSSSESAGVSVSYLASVGMNLNQTTYGQQVLLLDTSGAFAQLQAQASGNGGAATVSLKAMGPVSNEEVTGGYGTPEVF